MAATVCDLLLARADDGGRGLVADPRPGSSDDQGADLSWALYVERCGHVARLVRELVDTARPLHVGALLDNDPEMTYLLGAAGLGAFTLVGLNTTRRGEGLAADVRRSHCRLVVTSAAYRPLLEGLDLGGARVLVVDDDGPDVEDDWSDRVNRFWEEPLPAYDPSPDDLMMLIFTSGTSGEPKAVRITHQKVVVPGEMLAGRFGLTGADTAYLAMPLFHSNAVMAGWAVALASGATMALARRFSASGFLPDVRRFGATYANYVGKPLSHVLATPERPDDADNPLRLVFGNEAAERDIERFGRRFGCVVVDSYSSTENAVIVQRTPDLPPGALGRPLDGVEVLDPATGARVPDAVIDADGRLRNADEAVGELVNTTGAGFFAGYYDDPAADAERMRGGMYWSGDLAYRDAAGFVYFAGRSSEWLRVDGENLGVAPIERVLLRHPDVVEAAVYAVPDPSGVGDEVMAALVLAPGTSYDPDAFADFLSEQADLGTKARPRRVRVATDLPRTPTHKVLKRELSAQGVTGHDDPVWTLGS